jgi:hypothetical protein
VFTSRLSYLAAFLLSKFDKFSLMNFFPPSDLPIFTLDSNHSAPYLHKNFDQTGKLLGGLMKNSPITIAFIV